MIERSQAEIEADEVMHDIVILTNGGYVDLLNHLYAMHKLRDEKLYHALDLHPLCDDARDLRGFYWKLRDMQTY